MYADDSNVLERIPVLRQPRKQVQSSGVVLLSN